MTPLRKPKGVIWYSKVPVGHNTLSKTVSYLCKDGGISGYKTNYSLCVTAARRLFHSGVDEQLIMSHTGHRSVDGVRTYKRETAVQKRSVSDVLNSASNGQPALYLAEVTKKVKLSEDNTSSSEYNIRANQAVATNNTAGTATVTFNFSGCFSITINYLKD